MMLIEERGIKIIIKKEGKVEKGILRSLIIGVEKRGIEVKENLKKKEKIGIRERNKIKKVRVEMGIIEKNLRVGMKEKKS